MPNSQTLRFINAARFAEDLIKKDKNLMDEALTGCRKRSLSDQKLLKIILA